MRTLFEGEKILLEADNKKLVLTNKRIWKEDSDGGKSFHQSIMLNHISSIQCQIENYVLLLLIAAIFLGLAIFLLFADENKILPAISILISITCKVFYFLTKRSVISVCSSSTKIKLITTKMKKDKVLGFIDMVESAISELKPI